MSTASTLKKKKKIQQRIHREELALARLITKANKKRRGDARLKLRLGGLIFLLDWQELAESQLADRLKNIAKNIENATTDDTQSYRILGENTLRTLESDKLYEPSPSHLSEDEKRLLNHQKIAIGGLLVKYKLDDINRATLFGALLDYNKKLHTTTSPTRAKLKTRSKKTVRKWEPTTP